MKRLIPFLTLAGLAGLMLCAPSKALAQRGNIDPEQMRQQMMENIRTRLDVKGDDEWKLISERVTKVQDAQRTVLGFTQAGGGLFGRGGGRRGGDQGGDQGGNGG